MIGSARRRVVDALERSGVEHRVHDLYRDGFSPELTAHEHRHHVEPGVSDDVAGYARDLAWADTLVFVYPTWWSGQPAMLKGWIDRVLAAGVAWELPDGANRLVPRLRGVRHIVAVTTHGSSKAVNSLQGEGGKRTLFRSVRAMCHPLCRTHWVALYGIDVCDDSDRRAFLDRVDESITRLVS